MKKSVMVIILLILSCVTTSYSQIIKNYGIKIGVTNSNFTVKNLPIKTIGTQSYVPVIETGNLLSPTLSLFAQFVEANLLNVEIEIGFIQKGMSKVFHSNVMSSDQPDGTYQTADYTFEQTVKYLQLNVNSQLKYKIGSVIPYMIIGPSVGYLLGISGFTLTNEMRKDFLFGYNLGLGVNLGELFNREIFVEAKYNGDFSKFINENSPEYWHKVWVFNIGTNL